MNLHITHDDKFIDDFIEMANSLGSDVAGSNTYLVYSPPPYKYIKSKNIITAPLGSQAFKDHTSNLKKHDKIFIHFLSYALWHWLENFETSADIYWLFYGTDFYETHGLGIDLYERCIGTKLYDRLTKEYIQRANEKIHSHFPPLHFYRKIKYNLNILKKIKREIDCRKRVFKKINYILHFNKYDFQLILSKFATQAKLLHFYYPCTYFERVDEILCSVSPPVKTDIFLRNIWIGNSGDPLNNHLDIFSKLEGIDNKVGLWTSLSYGNNEYIKFLSSRMREKFGMQFQPITTYYSYEEFVSILGKMDVALMGHNISQGLGNIALLLYMGKKVFIKEATATFRYLQDCGLTIYPLKDINNHDFFDRMHPNDVLKNKEIISEIFSREKAKGYFRQFL